MPSTYTTSLSLTLPATGELSGTWGTTVNTGITSLVDDSVAGTTTITMVAADYTLTTTQGATNEARRMFLTMTGTPGAARNVIVPAVSKLYFVYNNTTGGFAQTVKTSAGTGVSVPNGARVVLYCDGTNVVNAVNTATFSTPLDAASGGTGQSSYTVGDLLYASGTTALSKLADVATGNALISGGVGVAPSWGKIGLTTHVTGTLPVANGGTGLTSGTSGGVLFYSATGTLASSSLLAANSLMIGGGAGLAPSTITTGTGVTTALGVNTGSAGAFVVNGGALGTPSGGTLSSCTGLPISTGVSGLGAGVATFLGTPSSANLAAAVTDETGSGALVFGTSPSLTTPALSGETFSTSATVTAGTNAQGQGALTNDYNVITTAANNPSGVTLPTATTGRRIIVVNKGANPINVFPATGGAIDALGVNTPISIVVGGYMEFNASSTTQWYSTANIIVSSTGAVTSFSAGATGLTPASATTGAITLAGTLAVANGGTGLTSGTSGGVLYYSAAGTLASSAALAASSLVVGGGAGVAPSTITTGTGVTTALGVAVGSAGAFVVNGGALGTPSSGTLTNATGLPISTGVSGLGANVATFLTTPSSFNLAAAVTDETGSGSLVFSNSPTLSTPNLGTPSALTLTNATGLPLTSGVTGTLPVGNGGTGATTLTGVLKGNGTSAFTAGSVSLSSEVSGTLPVANGGTGITAFGTGVATALGQNVTGSGSIVLSSSPTLTTPNLGTPSALTLTNATGLPLSTGVTGTLGGANGGTGTTSFGAANRVPYASSTTALTNSANLTFDGSTLTVDGIVVSTRGKGTGTTVIGNGALATAGTHFDNTAIGYSALYSVNTGSTNTGVGNQAGYGTSSGYDNTFVGFWAGKNVTAGHSNIVIGSSAGGAITTGAANIIVGTSSNASSGTSTNEYVFGHSITGQGSNTAYIGGTNGAYNEKNVTTWQTVSDARIKKNISDNSDGLGVIKQIKVRNFEYRQEDEIVDLPKNVAIRKAGVQLGVIAQEFQQVLPNCVTENSTGVLSVNTDPLIWHLVNAIKELSAEIEALKAKV